MKICFSQESAEEFVDFVITGRIDEFNLNSDQKATWNWLSRQVTKQGRKKMISALAWGNLPEHPDAALWKSKYGSDVEWLHALFSFVADRSQQSQGPNAAAS